MPELIELTDTEKQIIYYILSREFDKEPDSEEATILDALRYKFKPKD